MDRWSWTISIPGTPSMVPVARTFVRAFLNGHPLARDAELIASEYATNAIRHTASGDDGVIHLTIAATPHSVRIEVTDHGPPAESRPVPAPRHELGAEQESGRGLLIVDGLSARWGHYGVAGGQATAWAVLGDAGEFGDAGQPGHTGEPGDAGELGGAGEFGGAADATDARRPGEAPGLGEPGGDPSAEDAARGEPGDACEP